MANARPQRRSVLGTTFFLTVVLLLAGLSGRSIIAQNPRLQERLAEIRQAAALNKQALARYTWQEQETISIKGEVKKQKLFQVRMTPDGQPQKTPLDPQQSSSLDNGRPGLRQSLVEKNTEEYREYAQQIEALAQSYTQPDPQRLQQAYQRGNVTLGSEGIPGKVQLMFANYVKPNDSVSLVFNQAERSIQSLRISSYLDSPNDAVTISVQYSKLPDGTNHVSSMLVNGVSKQLTVATQTLDYQKM